jgi:hypothetical protein
MWFNREKVEVIGNHTKRREEDAWRVWNSDKMAFIGLSRANDPTLEQALVVPAFRKCSEGSSSGGNAKSAYLKH